LKEALTARRTATEAYVAAGKVVDAAFSARPVAWLDFWAASAAALGDFAVDCAAEDFSVVHVAHGVIRIAGVFIFCLNIEKCSKRERGRVKSVVIAIIRTWH